MRIIVTKEKEIWIIVNASDNALQMQIVVVIKDSVYAMESVACHVFELVRVSNLESFVHISTLTFLKQKLVTKLKNFVMERYTTVQITTSAAI